MIRWVSIIVILAALPAWSAPITVKSGEHDEFTRLVVYLQKDARWKLSETQDLATLTVQDWTDGFDISDVFTRIGTNRLQSLASSDGSLVISLGCQCTVIANELEQGFISLDIRETSVRRPALKPTLQEDNIKPEVEPLKAVSSVAQAPIDLPIIFEQPSETALLERAFKVHAEDHEGLFETSLGKEIARSATLTYLVPSGTEIQSNRSSGARSQTELLAELSDRARFSNAGNSSSFNSNSNTDEDVCPLANDYAVSKWGGELPFSEQLAVLRGGLYSEFDKIDQNAVRNLGRFYAHYGLVEEARQISENFEAEQELSDILALAEVVGSSVTDGGDQQDFSNCEGETGFWSILAKTDPIKLTQDLSQKQIAVFQKLPFHLQELTADRLVNLLSDAGFPTDASVVRNLLRRADELDEQPEQSSPLDTELARLSQDRLLELVELNDQSSPEALAFYLDNAANSDASVSPEQVELAAAYSRQLDGTDTAKRLLSGQVLALAGRREAAKAMEVFFANDRNSFEDPIGLQERLLNKLRSLEKPSDVSKFVWKLNERNLLGEISKGELLDVAKFLSEFGQPELVSVLLGKVQDSTETEEVIASALALSGRQEEAARLIAGFQQDQINPRLSQTILSENPDAAWDLRERLSGPAGARAAWITKNWQNVPNEDAAFEVSELLARSQDSFETSEKPIEDAQTAFSDSENARRVLQNLLN